MFCIWSDRWHSLNKLDESVFFQCNKINWWNLIEIQFRGNFIAAFEWYIIFLWTSIILLSVLSPISSEHDIIHCDQFNITNPMEWNWFFLILSIGSLCFQQFLLRILKTYVKKNIPIHRFNTLNFILVVDS